MHLYWATLGDGDNGTIARANLDGSDPNPNLVTGLSFPCGVALDGGHVYWAETAGDAIGRAALDGQAVTQTFVDGAPNVDSPCGVAVHDGHVFWANSDFPGSIGRADTSAPNTGVQQFVTGADQPCGVAANATHLYWANFGGSATGNTIGRASTTAPNTGVKQDLITTTGAGVCGVAIAAANVYWAAAGPGGLGNSTGSTVGRAGLDGAGRRRASSPAPEGPVASPSTRVARCLHPNHPYPRTSSASGR